MSRDDAAYHADQFAEAALDADMEFNEAIRMVRTELLKERRRRQD